MKIASGLLPDKITSLDGSLLIVMNTERAKPLRLRPIMVHTIDL